MNNFDSQLLRLKAALGLHSDKGVASALGMSPNALNERKRRDAFPVDKVRALSQELGIDSHYVETGVSQAATELIAAAKSGAPMQPVGETERALLLAWMNCNDQDQRLVMNMAKRLAKDAPHSKYVRSKRSPPIQAEKPADKTTPKGKK